MYDNIDKQRTYKEYCGKYRKAINEEFYFEAMMIAYSMMEDRLRSFLYHIGAFDRRTDTKICKKVHRQLKTIVKEYKNKNENELMKVSTISDKIKIIRCSLKWATTVDGGYDEDKYLVALKSQYEGSFDVGEFLEVLDEIDKWREYRNEIMHALLNKNVESLWEELASQTEKGMQLARKLDAYVKLVKKNNRIRKAIKLPVNR